MSSVTKAIEVRRTWRPALLVERLPETQSATTLVFRVPDWEGHLPGQHVDVRLTAEDGYQATRSYSLAAPTNVDQVVITVQRANDGEVSPFLVDDVAVGDTIEVRGPLGGWFVLRPTDNRPVFLAGGGSGIVPLMSMVRARARDKSGPVRLLCSVRTPDDRIYATELDRLNNEPAIDITWAYTRVAPAAHTRAPGRLTQTDLVDGGFSPDLEPSCFICGPTGFVESAASLLIATGHDPSRIRTERFG